MAKAPKPLPEQPDDHAAGREPGIDDGVENSLIDQEQREEQGVVGESKADKFVRLAKPRTNRAITAIASIGKLAAGSYESTEEQRSKVFSALQRALDDAKAAFKPVKKGADEFNF